jgi:hypothetical protein
MSKMTPPGVARSLLSPVAADLEACAGHVSGDCSAYGSWSLGDSNPDLFYAIDSRPVWWTGAEAGDRSPGSVVECDCASGLVSSLVISVVVRRPTGWRHTGGHSGFDDLVTRPRLNAAAVVPAWPEASTTS